MLTHLNLGYGGRLGNQMSQIAGIIGLAQRFGHNFAFPYWKNFEHLDKFGSTEDIDVQSWFKNKLPVAIGQAFEDLFIEYNTEPESISIAAHNNYNITQQYSGHLQSEKWFAHCQDLIRHYFEFDEHKVSLNNKYPNFTKVLMRARHTCGIHVRVGDYAKDDSWQPVLNLKYYRAAMDMFPSDTIFIVFSDDPKRAEDLLIFDSGKTVTFISGNHYMVDLYLMTQCKHMIIGNSTFSWWGAWLNKNPDKKIVAPSTWWKPHIEAQWGYSTKHLFPENWTII